MTEYRRPSDPAEGAALLFFLGGSLLLCVGGIALKAAFATYGNMAWLLAALPLLGAGGLSIASGLDIRSNRRDLRNAAARKAWAEADEARAGIGEREARTWEIEARAGLVEQKTRAARWEARLARRNYKQCPGPSPTAEPPRFIPVRQNGRVPPDGDQALERALHILGLAYDVGWTEEKLVKSGLVDGGWYRKMLHGENGILCLMGFVADRGPGGEGRLTEPDRDTALVKLRRDWERMNPVEYVNNPLGNAEIGSGGVRTSPSEVVRGT